LLSNAKDGAIHAVPGSFRYSLVSGFREGGAEVYVRSQWPPIEVRRVALSDGAVTPHLQIVPPPLGRRGLDAFGISAAGDAYAYSYGQELSRLYVMTGA